MFEGSHSKILSPVISKYIMVSLMVNLAKICSNAPQTCTDPKHVKNFEGIDCSKNSKMIKKWWVLSITSDFNIIYLIVNLYNSILIPACKVPENVSISSQNWACSSRLVVCVCVYFNWDIRITPFPTWSQIRQTTPPLSFTPFPFSIPHLISQLVGPSLHLLQLIAHVSVFGHGSGEGWLGAWDGVSVMGLATQPGKKQISTCESLYVYVKIGDINGPHFVSLTQSSSELKAIFKQGSRELCYFPKRSH